MTWSGWQLPSAGLLLACLASFRWGMRNFFAQPAGDTAGMRVIRTCGLAFAALHLGRIVFTPSVRPDKGWGAACCICARWDCTGGRSEPARRAPSRRPFRRITPQHLVERGPYRFIRHPLYAPTCWRGRRVMVATASPGFLPTLAVMLGDLCSSREDGGTEVFAQSVGERL